MFSLELPHRGDSNEYTQYIMFSLELRRRGDFYENTQYTRTIFNIKKKIMLNCPESAAMCFSKGLKNELETAVVHEPSVFKPPKVYCIALSVSKEKRNLKTLFVHFFLVLCLYWLLFLWYCKTLYLCGIKFSRFNGNDILAHFNFAPASKENLV